MKLPQFVNNFLRFRRSQPVSAQAVELRVVRLERRRVLNGDPAGLQQLVVDAGSWMDDGASDTFELEAQGDEVTASHNGKQVAAALGSEFSGIELRGSTDDDVFDLYLSNDIEALPGIEIKGGGGHDVIRIHGSGGWEGLQYELNGAVGRLLMTTPDSTNTITFSDIDVVDDTLESASRSFSFDEAMVLQSADADQLELSGNQSIRFLLPQSPEDALAAEQVGSLRIDASSNVTLRDIQLHSTDVTVEAEHIVVSGSVHSHNADIYLDASGELEMTNSGSIHNPNGVVSLSAGSISHEGLISANGGQVTLLATHQVDLSASIVDVSSSEGDGGDITLVADSVSLQSNTHLDASGMNGGGLVLIGTDGATQHAEHTMIDDTSGVRADAYQRGDGGKIIVWSDGVALLDGSGNLSAQGGGLSGHGGMIETSGRQFVRLGAAVDVTAHHGQAGHWLIDPIDVVIRTKGADPIPNPGAFNNLTDINAATLVTALSSGATVEIRTDGKGAFAGNITVLSGLDQMKLASTGKLRLVADNDIIIDAKSGGITATTGSIQLDLRAKGGVQLKEEINAGGKGGAVNIQANGLIDQQADITTTGAVTVISNLDSISMANDATTFAAGLVRYEAAEHIGISRLESTETGVAALADRNLDGKGAILDASKSEAANIVAKTTTAILAAGSGIGGKADSDIDTTVGALVAENTTVGGISIEETDNLTIKSTGVLNQGNGTIDLALQGKGVLTVEDDITSDKADVRVTAAAIVQKANISTGGKLSMEATDQAITQTAGVTARGDAGVELKAGTDVVLAQIKSGGAVNVVADTNGNGVGAIVALASKTDHIQAETQTVTLRAGSGIGHAKALAMSAGDLSATNTTTGSIQILESNGLTITGDGLANVNEAIQLEVANGDLTIGGTISLKGKGGVILETNAGALKINKSVTSTLGAISISAKSIDQAALLDAGTNVTAKATDGNVTMLDGTSTQAGASVSLTANGSIFLSRVEADVVSVSAGADKNGIGAIVDNTVLEQANIVANEVALSAGAGIGDGAGKSDINTAASSLTANNVVSGAIRVANSGTALTADSLANKAAGENLEITQSGSLTISGIVEADGDVVIRTADDNIDGTAAERDDLRVLGSAVVRSVAGDIELHAGDDILTEAFTTLSAPSATGQVLIQADAGKADVGVGSTVTLLGTVDSKSIAVTGGADADTFEIAPSKSAPLVVDGANPAAAPGDTLKIFSPTFGTVVAPPASVTPAGKVTFKGVSHQAIQYKGIEHLALGGRIWVSGSGKNDVLTLDATDKDSGSYVLQINGTSNPRIGLFGVIDFTFDALAGDDHFILNHAKTTPFMPSSGTTYLGGTQTGGPNGDQLTINEPFDTLAISLLEYTMDIASDASMGPDGELRINDFPLGISLSDRFVDFRGVELIQNLTAVQNHGFKFIDVPSEITLTDSKAAGQNEITSQQFSDVRFRSPLVGTRIDTRGGAAHTLSIAGLDATYDAFLGLSGDKSDTVNFVKATNVGSATMATGAFRFEAAVMSGGTKIIAFNDVEFTSKGSLQAAAIAIDSGGTITMADGSFGKATNSALTLDAEGDIALAELAANKGFVRVTSRNGAITDNTKAELTPAGPVNLSGLQVELSAARGIGAGNTLGGAADIDVRAVELDARNSASGVINIHTADSVALDLIDNRTDSVILDSLGAITDGNGVDALNLRAGTAEIRAQRGVGQGELGSGGDIDANVTSGVAITTNTGDIHLHNNSPLTITSLPTLQGIAILNATPLTPPSSITLRASGGMNITEAISNVDGGNVIVAVEGSGQLLVSGDIVLSSSDKFNDASGNIWITSDGGITIADNVRIQVDGAGNIVVAAGIDTNGGAARNGATASLNMKAGSAIQSDDGDVLLTATNDIRLTEVATTGRVAIVADSEGVEGGAIDHSPSNSLHNGQGGILDNRATEAPLVQASELLLRAGSGIGNHRASHVDDLDVAVGLLAAETTSGPINLHNDRSLLVGTFASLAFFLPNDPVGAPTFQVGALSGASIRSTKVGASDITLRADGKITATGDVFNQSGGNVTIAAEGNTNDRTLEVANVDVENGDANVDEVGNIWLYAGSSLDVQGEVTTSGGGAVALLAGLNFGGGNEQDGSTSSSILMNASTQVASSSGPITVLAPGDVSLGGLRTSGDVTVVADFGGRDGTLQDGLGKITDAGSAASGDALVNVNANELRLLAATGIGAGATGDATDLDVSVTFLAAHTGEGDINVHGNGNIETTDLGSITVSLAPNGAPGDPLLGPQSLQVGAVAGLRISNNSGTDDAGEITLRTSGALIVDAVTNNNDGGNITLAAEGSDKGSVLRVGQDVTTSRGNIWLLGGSDIVVSSQVSTSKGDILALAGSNLNGGSPQSGFAGATFQMTEGTELRAVDGNALITAPGNVQLSHVDADTVTVLADAERIQDGFGTGKASSHRDGQGSITDNRANGANDKLADESNVPNITASQVLLRAGSGVGTGGLGQDGDVDIALSPLATDGLLAGSTTTGDFNISHLGKLFIGKIPDQTFPAPTTTPVGPAVEVFTASGTRIGSGVGKLTVETTAALHLEAPVQTQFGTVTLAAPNLFLNTAKSVTTRGGAIDMTLAPNLEVQQDTTLSSLSLADNKAGDIRFSTAGSVQGKGGASLTVVSGERGGPSADAELTDIGTQKALASLTVNAGDGKILLRDSADPDELAELVTAGDIRLIGQAVVQQSARLTAEGNIDLRLAPLQTETAGLDLTLDASQGDSTGRAIQVSRIGSDTDTNFLHQVVLNAGKGDVELHGSGIQLSDDGTTPSDLQISAARIVLFDAPLDFLIDTSHENKGTVDAGSVSLNGKLLSKSSETSLTIDTSQTDANGGNVSLGEIGDAKASQTPGMINVIASSKNQQGGTANLSGDVFVGTTSEPGRVEITTSGSGTITFSQPDLVVETFAEGATSGNVSGDIFLDADNDNQLIASQLFQILQNLQEARGTPSRDQGLIVIPTSPSNRSFQSAIDPDGNAEILVFVVDEFAGENLELVVDWFADVPETLLPSLDGDDALQPTQIKYTAIENGIAQVDGDTNIDAQVPIAIQVNYRDFFTNTNSEFFEAEFAAFAEHITLTQQTTIRVDVEFDPQVPADDNGIVFRIEGSTLPSDADRILSVEVVLATPPDLFFVSSVVPVPAPLPAINQVADVVDTMFEITRSPAEIASATFAGISPSSVSVKPERYYELRIVTYDQSGEVAERPLQKTMTELFSTDENSEEFDPSQLPKLFKRLPDDRYRLYLVEEGADRMVLDFLIRDGQPSEPQNTEVDDGQPMAPTEDGPTDTPPSTLPSPQAVQWRGEHIAHLAGSMETGDSLRRGSRLEPTPTAPIDSVMERLGRATATLQPEPDDSSQDGAATDLMVSHPRRKTR